MMLKMKCFGALAGCALATGALYATAPTYKETFEEDPDPSTWTGGTVTTSDYAYSVTGSARPLPSVAHTKVLVIEGAAAYTNNTGTTLTGSPVVDMMVQTARPDDELGFPSSENQSDIQIAVAVDSNGCFNVYCKNKSDVLGWYALETRTVGRDATGWARVSFLFDYGNNVCQIRVDGQPMVTENGYLTADKGTPGNGSWYKLALATTASSAVSSMKVIGCTAVDDIVMNVDEGYTYPLDTVNTADASGVPYAWYDQYGISWDASGVYDTSGLTAAQKYDACLSPTDGQTFAVKSVTADAANSKVVVGIPATVNVPGRQVVLEYGSTPEMTETPIPVSAGDTTVDVALPAAGAVQYFRLKAKATAQ